MNDGAIFEHVMVSSGDGGVQRLAVIASGVGRRRWTREAKARIIAESMVPGANVAEVARRNDMQPQHLYLWRRTAMERMEARGQAAFVPVMIDESRRELPVLPVSAAEIGVDVCGLTLRIPEGVSADHIRRVLLAVRGTS
jgi:transposase